MFPTGYKPGPRYKRKRCRICNTIYPMKETQCPSCGTYFYCELVD